MIDTTTAPAIAMSVDGRVARDTGMGWVLWTVALALPWLLPTHSEPWTTFYSEWLMAIVLMPVAIWAVVATRSPWRCDTLAAATVVTACLPVAQALGGMFTFPGEALLNGLYLCGLALTILVARHVEEAAPKRVADSLFASLGVAALLSTGMIIYQWFDLEGLGVLLASSGPAGRPIANVGQANNLSTLLVWGLIAIWWGYARRSLGGWVVTLAAAFLLTGVALTQSRTGLVAVCGLALAALLNRRSLHPSPRALVVIGLTAWFALLVLGLESISQVMLRTAPLTLTDQVAAGKRPMIWILALEAIFQRPWLGYGWNQSVQAHVTLSERFPDLHTTIQFAHNAVLDLLLWNGLPLGLLLVGGLVLWFWHQLRGALSQEHRLVLLALGVFILHAMLELPHAIAFFLLPVAVMMGTLSAWRPLRTIVTVPRIVVALIVLIHGGMLVLMFVDYRRIEVDRMAHRMREARIGNLAAAPAPDVVVLGSLQAALVALRMEPKRGMQDEDLEQLRMTVVRYPGGLFRYARASALNSHLDEAQWALAVLCRLRSPVDCKSAAQNWQVFADDGNPEMAKVVLPPEMKAALRN